MYEKYDMYITNSWLPFKVGGRRTQNDSEIMKIRSMKRLPQEQDLLMWEHFLLEVVRGHDKHEIFVSIEDMPGTPILLHLYFEWVDFHNVY